MFQVPQCLQRRKVEIAGVFEEFCTFRSNLKNKLKMFQKFSPATQILSASFEYATELSASGQHFRQAK
jgi:hypothetical protein